MHWLLVLAADNPSPTEAVNDPTDFIVIGLTALFFIVFLQLMKAIAFGPIFGLLEKRERLLTSGLGEVDAERARIGTLREDYEQQLAGVRAEALEATQALIGEGKKSAQARLEAGRQEYLAAIGAGRAQIREERAAASAATVEQVTELAFETLDRILPAKIDRAAEQARVQARVQEAMR